MLVTKINPWEIKKLYKVKMKYNQIVIKTMIIKITV